MSEYLSKSILNNKILKDSYFSFKSIENFENYFLHFIKNFDDLKNKIKIYDIMETDNFKDDKFNIMYCIENCNFHKHYKHYNKFKEFGNKQIKLYLYNHISKIMKTETQLAIPVIYLQTEYYNKWKDTIKPLNIVNFKDKKFCLMVSFPRSYNKFKKQINKNKIALEKLGGSIDSIKNQNISRASCYHSEELMNVFNRYKFIICLENSYTDGYITEKIFNCFFSRSIPIYKGPKDTNKFINKNSYIDLIDLDLDKIKLLMNNEDEYNKIININKIMDYDNENYTKIANDFIKTNIES